MRVYLTLTLLSNLSFSMIWGINTLFLLDAGLSNAAAFTANALYSAGQFVFEVPTGVVADTRGRRASFLWGSATLIAATLLYLLMWQLRASLWGWGLASILLGLGFTFFSGATEAWLVDALHHTGFDGALESVFSRGQIVSGGAMLAGSVAGGFIAEATNLGVPYLIRAALLVVAFAFAFRMMQDLGFTPGRSGDVWQEVKNVVAGAVESGWGSPPVRWLMLSAPFLSGIGFYAFYAAQPYLLQLYGDESAFGVAGLMAALYALAQIGGGAIVPKVRRWFPRRTWYLITMAALSTVAIAILGLTRNFWVALIFVSAWAVFYTMSTPVRQAFINGCIPSERRATVLSLDNLMSAGGSALAQPGLGRVADASGYPASYLLSAGVQTLALPFLWLARRENSPGDVVDQDA
ncbi:MAG TPA: MFS transporter [Acidimicrobiia bacterium]|nr:MFS transporter [Acidimicrobiia bacterium]